MTEDEARQWIVDRFGVSRETLVHAFVSLVLGEATKQNLVAASTIPAIWHRHVVDSAQLIPLADNVLGNWIDIGSGAGFPGMVIALLTDRHVTMIEPRRRRADFLANAANALGLSNCVTVVPQHAHHYIGKAAVISARAVASLTVLLGEAAHLSTRKTLWLLPKGAGALEEVAAARDTWHGSFHVEHSVTEPSSLIITAKGVARR